LGVLIDDLDSDVVLERHVKTIHEVEKKIRLYVSCSLVIDSLQSLH
jgi:hypothetical protein